MTRCYTDLFSLLLESIKETKSEIIFISAFITSDVMSKIFLNMPRNVKVTVISRFSKQDILFGSSDLKAARIVIENGGRILRNPNLHAKLFLFDKESLIYGSANLTNRGLGLAQNSNIECISTSVKANSEDIFFVNSIIESSQVVDYSLLDEFEEQLEMRNSSEFDEKQIEKVSKKLAGLFINDFPFCDSPELILDNTNESRVAHDLQLLKLRSSKFDMQMINERFMDSKIMNWINFNIQNQMKFGELSAKIHESLLDDPKPYRKEIKDLQKILLNWIHILLPDKFEIFIPNGFHSQILRKK